MIRANRFGGCLLLSAAVLAGDACAQGPRSNSKTITWQSAVNSNDMQVGILGEIAKPGVYHVDAESLSVQSLVRRAGGLTDDASMSIRIVRQERVAQSLFFSPQADSRLMPGDVLVVESKRALAEISKVMSAEPLANPIRPVAASSAEPLGVQIAFLNVLDTPVIVKLHPEDARIEHVVQMLGQPIELAGSVRVLGPERISSALSQRTSSIPRLSDGAVLIFPRGSINRSKLPTLPKPYGSEIAYGASPSLIGGPLGQSPELRSVGQLAPLMFLPSYGSAPSAPMRNSATAPITVPALITAPASMLPVAPPIPDFDPQPGPIPVVSSRPRIATLPFTGAAPTRSSSSRGPFESESIAPPPQDDPQPQSMAGNRSSLGESARTTLKSNAKLNDLSGKSNLVEPTESAGASPFTAVQMFGILAGVSALIGAALLARKHFDKQVAAGLLTNTRRDIASHQQPPIKSEISTDAAISSEIVPPAATPIEKALSTSESMLGNKLDRLIRNDLPVREEAAVFPELIVLQGRIAPRPTHRLDRAAEGVLGSGPHFATSANSSENASEEAAVTELDAHLSNEVRVSGPHFERRRHNTRPITIGDASRAAAITPREATPSTPLADALRQLQGDRLS